MSELHPLERTLLQALRDGVKSFKELEESTGLPEASISRAALWLASKGYIQIKEVRKSFVSLGPEGRRFSKGLPERVLAETMSKKGKLLLSYAQRRSTLSRDDFTLAIGWARRKGWIRIAKEGGRTYLVPTGRIEEGPDETLLKHLSQGPIAIDQNIAKLLKSPSFTRPNIVSISEEVERSVELTPTGRSLSERGELPRESVSQLTPELLLSGRWKEVELRRYDIHAPVTPVWPGKKHPYRQFLDNVKWKLVAMGFKEMVGPAVELMFFNCATLHMPQDHPAREIHDIYFVKKPRMGNLKEYSARLVNVKEVHEGGGKTGSIGWGYRFSIPESRRFILRSQGTAISARTLLSRDLEIPGKYFSVARIFRPDVVDRTHLTEFNQIEGIVLGEELTLSLIHI